VVGVFPCAPQLSGRSMGKTWPRYGGDARGRAARSAHPGPCARCTWHERRGPEGRLAREGLAAGLGVRAQQNRGAATRGAGARSGAQGAKNSLDWHTSTEFFSKKLNYSGQTFEYQSCRSLDPVQLLQRVYGLFLKQLCTNCMPSWQFSGRR
jgi:hypothetical protein